MRNVASVLVQFGPIGIVIWLLFGALMASVFDMTFIGGLMLVVVIFIGSVVFALLVFGLFWLGEYLATRFFPELFP